MSHSPIFRAALISAAAGVWLAAAPPAMAQTSTTATATPRIAATLVNPCTRQYVSVAGAVSLTLTETVAGNGEMTVGLSTVTKAIGAAFSAVATKYPMSDSDNLVVRSSGPEPFNVLFNTKLVATGPTRSDNWQLTVAVKATVDQYGRITAASAMPAGAVCIG